MIRPGSRICFLRAGEAELIARLLINDHTQTAFGRVADRSRPHFLVIDEAYRYLTEDIEDILEGTRKFGLHLGLVHHYPGQLRTHGGNIFEGVMAGAQNKLFFGTTYSIAQEMVDDVYGGQFDPERIKHVLDRETVVGTERAWFASKSTAMHEAQSSVRSHAFAASAMDSFTESYSRMYGGPFDVMPSAWTASESDGSATSTTEIEGEAAGESSGKSETTGLREGLEQIWAVRPNATFTLEEERHRFTRELSELEEPPLYSQGCERGDVQGHDCGR